MTSKASSRGTLFRFTVTVVITSYSIHYTKLYELEVLDIDSAKQRTILGADERRNYKTYKLGLISATDFSEKIKNVLSEEDKILVDKDKNQLIVFARPREILLIDSILEDYKEEIKSDRSYNFV